MRRRGLTVVEVLVASAIVLVFLAIAYPAARALTGRAQGSACAEKLHTLGNAFVMYANDHDGYLPAATTAEWAHRNDKGVPADELAASPQRLRDLMRPYVASDGAWFCPVDPQRGKDTLWLGQRHRLTSYRFDPVPQGDDVAWPPKAQLGHGDAPLVSDAYGVPSADSDRQFRGDKKPASNHADGMVNVVTQDLSLSRRKASALTAEP